MDYTLSLSLIGLQTARHQMTRTLRPQISKSNPNAWTHPSPSIVCQVRLSAGGTDPLQCKNTKLLQAKSSYLSYIVCLPK